MNKRYKLDFQVTGNEDSIRSFIKMCGIIQYCCNVGASRDMRVEIDGDGSANLGFNVKWGDSDEYKEMDSYKFDLNGNPPTVYIGE